MDYVDVAIKTHWLNGWFLRLFSTPYAVAGSSEQRLTWGRTEAVPLGENGCVGVGVRYFDKGSLLGVEEAQVKHRRENASTLVFRNGFWNHDPFRLV